VTQLSFCSILNRLDFCRCGTLLHCITWSILQPCLRFL
jgi:hypothetical protein